MICRMLGAGRETGRKVAQWAYRENPEIGYALCVTAAHASPNLRPGLVTVRGRVGDQMMAGHSTCDIGEQLGPTAVPSNTKGSWIFEGESRPASGKISPERGSRDAFIGLLTIKCNGVAFSLMVVHLAAVRRLQLLRRCPSTAGDVGSH